MLPNGLSGVLRSDGSHGSSPDRIVVLDVRRSWRQIMSAKLNDIDPQAWLADVLANIADTPISRLEQLLPWNWTPELLNAQAA